MGRQILLHMLPEDRTSFLKFVQERDHVDVTDFTDLISGDVQPAALGDRGARSEEWLCLWNRDLVPSLGREHIPESNIGPYYRPYYRIDSSAHLRL